MPTLQDIFAQSLANFTQDAHIQETIVPDQDMEPEELEPEELEWEELDETKYPPCSKCGSHDLWLPLAPRDIASDDPTWQCRKCDRKPNTKAQMKLERLKLKWDKV